MKDMIPVVFSSDHNYLMPTSVAILSMLDKLQGAIADIYILESNDVTDEDRDMLTKMVQEFNSLISFIPIGEQFNDTYETRGITKATYFRLKIPWLFRQFDKVVYCDGDILFMDNIKDLYEIEIGDSLVAGCPIASYSDDDHVRKVYGKVDCSHSDYINAGVLIINCKRQRDLNLYQKYEEKLSNKYEFQDQDIINIICKGNKWYLPIRYNLSPTLSIYSVDSSTLEESKKQRIIEAIKSPCIIHFAGSKPWKVFTYYWTDWWTVYKRSPFFDCTLERIIAETVINPTYPTRRLIAFFCRKNVPILLRVFGK